MKTKLYEIMNFDHSYNGKVRNMAYFAFGYLYPNKEISKNKCLFQDILTQMFKIFDKYYPDKYIIVTEIKSYVEVCQI